jgi:hypothetical protein
MQISPFEKLVFAYLVKKFPSVPIRVHMNPTLVCSASHMNRVHKLYPYLLIISFNIIILPLYLYSNPFSLLFDINFHCIPHITHKCYMSSPSHFLAFYYPNNTWRLVQRKKLIVMESLSVSYESLLVMPKYSQHLLRQDPQPNDLTLGWQMKFHILANKSVGKITV